MWFPLWGHTWIHLSAGGFRTKGNWCWKSWPKALCGAAVPVNLHPELFGGVTPQPRWPERMKRVRQFVPAINSGHFDAHSLLFTATSQKYTVSVCPTSCCGSASVLHSSFRLHPSTATTASTASTHTVQDYVYLNIEYNFHPDHSGDIHHVK